MIAKLTGLLDSIGDDWLVLDVNGVGYHISASSQTLSTITPYLGQKLPIFIEPVLRNEQTHLFGFVSIEERAWFRLLTSIQGVGPKAALAIQSVLTPEGLNHALTFAEDYHFRRADGVGPKLALRIVTELKNKRPPIEFIQYAPQENFVFDNPISINPISPVPIEDGQDSKKPKQSKSTKGTPAPVSTKNNVLMDALMGLISLGYSRSEAAQALSTLPDETKELPLNELIKKALGQLSPLR